MLIMLNFRNVFSSILIDMHQLPIDNKWWILCNERQFTKLGSIVNNKKKAASSVQVKPRSKLSTAGENVAATYLATTLKPGKKKLTLHLMANVALHLKECH